MEIEKHYHSEDFQKDKIIAVVYVVELATMSTVYLVIPTTNSGST